jgi:hypothetical protein
VITYALMGIAALLVALIAALMPDLPDPANTLGQAQGGWATVLGFMGGASSWLPFGFAFLCVGIVAVIAVAAGVIKLVRMVASFLSGGGGSAA